MSSIIETYAPVILLRIAISNFLQPAAWWLCRECDANKGFVLAAYVLVAYVMPQVAATYLSEQESLAVTAAAIVAIMMSIVIVGKIALHWIKKRSARLEEDPAFAAEEQLNRDAWKQGTCAQVGPPLGYIMSTLKLTTTEDNLFDDQKKPKGESWPFLDEIVSDVGKLMSRSLDWLGFNESDHLITLENIMDDFNIEDDGGAELSDPLLRSSSEQSAEASSGGTKVRRSSSAAERPRSKENEAALFSVYSDFVATLGAIMTFGLASPLIAFAGVLGIVTKGLVLSMLAERWDEKVRAEETREVATDTQGMPFRCVMLLVFCSFAFFGMAALIGGVGSSYDGADAGVYVFFGFMAMLILEVLYLFRSDIKQTLSYVKKEEAARDSENGGDGEEEKKRASAARKSSTKILKAAADGDAAAAFGFNVAGIENFGVGD